MIIWKNRTEDQLCRITHRCQQGRDVLTSQLAPRWNQKVHDFHLVSPRLFCSWYWLCWLFAISLGVLTPPCWGLPWMRLESCSQDWGKLCRTMQTNTAGGVPIWGKSPNLAKMMGKKKKRFILCRHTVWESSVQTRIQLLSCYTDVSLFKQSFFLGANCQSQQSVLESVSSTSGWWWAKIFT